MNQVTLVTSGNHINLHPNLSYLRPNLSYISDNLTYQLGLNSFNLS